MDLTAPASLDNPPLLETAHVLFMDIVGYSRLPMERQSALLTELNGIVRRAAAVRREQDSERLIRLPTGDGMALVFFAPNPIQPVECALEISRELRERPDLPLRIGIHTGPVYRVSDINASQNVAGGGINLAQRVMDCGDAGHILLSSAVADVLTQLADWREAVRDLGQVEVKHGVRIHVYNYWDGRVGNPDPPARLAKQTSGAIDAGGRTIADTATPALHTALAWAMLASAGLAVLVLMKLQWFNLVPWSRLPAAIISVPQVSLPFTAAIGAVIVYQYWWARGGTGLLSMRGLLHRRDGRLSILKAAAFSAVLAAVAVLIWRSPATVTLSFSAQPIEAASAGFEKKFQNVNPDYLVQTSSHYELTIYTGKHNPPGPYLVRIGLHPYGTADGLEFSHLFVDKGYRRREPIHLKFDDSAASAFFELRGAREDFVGTRRVLFAGTYYNANTPKGAIDVDVSIQTGDNHTVRFADVIRPEGWNAAR